MPDDRNDVERLTDAFIPLSRPAHLATKALLHPRDPIEHEDAQFTDAAHAQRFANFHGFELRYHHRRGVWLWYDSPLWRPDDNDRIVRMVIAFARDCQDASMKLTRKEERERAVGFYFKMEGANYINRIIDLAKSLLPLADNGDGWDADLWRAGAPNGIINLRTGLLEPGDPADKISYSVRTPYDETIPPPQRWLQFLHEIFDGKQDVIAFVHRYCGYALTGSTKEQVMAMFHGKGANGKSTFLNTLSWILGDYSHNMPFSAVELKQRAAIPSDIAALEGRRFVTASETTDGTRLNEARIKALTGSDPMTARYMHSEFFTFQPVAKFILAVNHKPAVIDDSHGFWRRMKVVEFHRIFSGSLKDDELEKKLRGESAGILRWLVEGCLLWQRDGLPEVRQISDDTEAYQQDSDPLADFVQDVCQPELDSEAPTAQIQEAYQKWCDKNRIHKLERLTRKDFSRRLSEKFQRKHTRTGDVYVGIKIATDKMW